MRRMGESGTKGMIPAGSEKGPVITRKLGKNGQRAFCEGIFCRDLFHPSEGDGVIGAPP